jgi:aspartate-semialdehyde dehydrogenase
LTDSSVRIGVVGVGGAVGSITLQLLLLRGYTNIRAFGSWRSAGGRIGDFEIEEATQAALRFGGLDVCFFSIGAEASRELVPAAAEGGAVCIDKSSAFRLQDDVPLVVPEVNGERAFENRGIIANPNCCSIPLAMALAPLRDAVGLRRVRVATYQSVSGAGTDAIDRFRNERPEEHELRMDWPFDGVELDEETKIREETRKILELPDLAVSASCVRVPVMVGHAEAIWVETEEPLSAATAKGILSEAPGLEYEQVPRVAKAIGRDEVLVGRIRQDPTVENGIALFLVCDNLRKGAALNAIQIVELLMGASVPDRFGHRVS